MKLQAKGSSEYVRMRYDPALKAEAETRVVFSAFHNACSTLLAQVNQTSSPETQLYHAFVSLQKVQEELLSNMDKCSLMLQIIGDKLATVE